MIARSRAGGPGGAAPRRRSASMACVQAATQSSDTRAHSARTSALVNRSSAAASVTERCERKVAE